MTKRQVLLIASFCFPASSVMATPIPLRKACAVSDDRGAAPLMQSRTFLKNQ